MSELDVLLAQLDHAFDRKSWHGTNLRGALKGLEVAQLLWRPASGRPNIWELAVHAAYWKYAVLRQLKGLPKGGFPLPGSNWFRREAPLSLEAWKRDLVLLACCHRDLREAVAGLSVRDLDRPSAKREWRWRDLIEGVAAHDLYHTGQIQLIKRLHRDPDACV
jgi:uncharacterized damage-inducible protein DinB